MTYKEQLQQYVGRLTGIMNDGLHFHNPFGVTHRAFLVEERGKIDGGVEVSVHYAQNSITGVFRHYIIVQSTNHKDYIEGLYQQVYLELIRFSLFAITTVGRLKDCENNPVNIYSIQHLMKNGITTPELKALELMDKFQPHVQNLKYSPMSEMGDSPDWDEATAIKNKKACAMICVDLLISHLSSSNGNPPGLGEYEHNKEWWVKVKEHLNKL